MLSLLLSPLMDEDELGKAIGSVLGNISNFGFIFQNINLILDPPLADITTVCKLS